MTSSRCKSGVAIVPMLSITCWSNYTIAQSGHLALHSLAPAIVFVSLFAVCSVCMGWPFDDSRIEWVLAGLTPKCPSCRVRRLKYYPLPFSESTTFKYYSCLHCSARHKRSTTGEWVALRRSMNNKEQFRELFTKSACAICDVEDQVDDPFGSWS
jgi:hypothetical protein